MKAGPLLFRITGVAVFLQILLGGLLTFDFISPAPHIVVGLLVFVLAIATMVLAFVAKPSFKPPLALAAALVALVLIQIFLGFATLGTGSSLLALIHFVNAMAIYGVSIAGTFVSMRWDRMARWEGAGRGVPPDTTTEKSE